MQYRHGTYVYRYIRVRAPERLISSLGALGRGSRRRRRVLCLRVCVFVCVFVRSGGSPGGRPRPTHKGNLKVLSARVGRGRAGRDPPTRKTLRFPLSCDPLVATHPAQGRDPPGATHRPRPTRCDPPAATHPPRPTRCGPPAATHHGCQVFGPHLDAHKASVPNACRQ